MPAPQDVSTPPLPPRLAMALQRILLCAGMLDMTAISVLALMMQLGSGPFADSGGLAWPLLPLAGARLADAYGLTRRRDPLPRSAMINAVQVLLAATAAAIYARARMVQPAVAALGLAGGETLIFSIVVAALAARRCRGRRTSPAAAAPAGTGRPPRLAASESTVALTSLCASDHHHHQADTPAKAGGGGGGAYVAVVQPSGASFALALLVAEAGAGAGAAAAAAAATPAGPPPAAAGPLDGDGDAALASPPRPRPSSAGLQARRGGGVDGC